jgi:hypothetical protein
LDSTVNQANNQCSLHPLVICAFRS